MSGQDGGWTIGFGMTCSWIMGMNQQNRIYGLQGVDRFVEEAGKVKDITDVAWLF